MCPAELPGLILRNSFLTNDCLLLKQRPTFTMLSSFWPPLSAWMGLLHRERKRMVRIALCWMNGRGWTNKTTARRHGPLPFLFVVRYVVDLQLRASSTGPATQQPASTASVVKASLAWNKRLSPPSAINYQNHLLLLGSGKRGVKITATIIYLLHRLFVMNCSPEQLYNVGNFNTKFQN